MKIRLFILALSLCAHAAYAQSFSQPKVICSKNVQIINTDINSGYAGAGGTNRIYTLHYNGKVTEYRSKVPVARRSTTLTFVENMTVDPNEGGNVGTGPRNAKGYLGLYLLDPNGAGYEPGAIFTDGPIIYGTGMSDQDRRKAWANFFLMMVRAIDQQQGRKALGAKLVRSCLPHQNFCTTVLDANLVGINGIQEPRKVIVIIATDIHDQDKQLSRIVCTRPAPRKQVCRDWDTAKPVSTDIPLD
jgi:hypothetical protein